MHERIGKRKIRSRATALNCASPLGATRPALSQYSGTGSESFSALLFEALISRLLYWMGSALVLNHQIRYGVNLSTPTEKDKDLDEEKD